MCVNFFVGIYSQFEGVHVGRYSWRRWKGTVATFELLPVPKFPNFHHNYTQGIA